MCSLFSQAISRITSFENVEGKNLRFHTMYGIKFSFSLVACMHVRVCVVCVCVCVRVCVHANAIYFQVRPNLAIDIMTTEDKQQGKNKRLWMHRRRYAETS